MGKGAAGGSGAGEWEKIKEVGAHSASGESTVEDGGGPGRLLVRWAVLVYLEPQVQANDNQVMKSAIRERKQKGLFREIEMRAEMIGTAIQDQTRADKCDA